MAGEVTRIRAYARARSGGRDGLTVMRRIADDTGCPECLVAEEAWVAEQQGDFARAAELHERTLEHGYSFLALNGPYKRRSLLVVGPLHEQAGDTARAIEAYRRVTTEWAGADDRGMRVVREAQARIAALGG